MSDDDIDLDRVVVDPRYRRQVIEYLNETAAVERPELKSAGAHAGAESNDWQVARRS